MSHRDGTVTRIARAARLPEPIDERPRRNTRPTSTVATGTDARMRDIREQSRVDDLDELGGRRIAQLAKPPDPIVLIGPVAVPRHDFVRESLAPRQTRSP
jgi:hypothetical protein